MSVRGLDISHYQRNLTDFSLVKNAGFDFVIIKGSEGQSTDKSFEKHYVNAEKAGVARGVYVFSHANSVAKAKAEAQYIIKALNGRPLEMPIFVDLEADDINFAWNHNIMDWVLAFGETIKAAGYRWGTYSNQSWYLNKLNLDQLKEAGAAIWVAAYNGTQLTIEHDIHQYNNKGYITGYASYLDMDLMYDESIIQWGDSKPEVEPEPEPEQPEESETEETDEADGVLITSVEQAKQLLIENFKREVGYTEKATNSQLYAKTENSGTNNWNKYAYFIDTFYPNFYNYKKNGYDWCDIFYDCGLICTFGYENAKKLLCQPEKSTGAGCSYSAGFYKENGQFFNSPLDADQGFFGELGNEGHTGAIIAVDGKKITTVEGNAGARSNQVVMKTYDLNTYYMPGFGRPDWSILIGQRVPNLPIGGKISEDSSTPILPEVPDIYPMLSIGNYNEYVKKAQQILISKGYSVGPDGADGAFGINTYYAVKNFQEDNGLEVDGVIGDNTWAALLADKDTSDEEDKTEEQPETPVETIVWDNPTANVNVSLPLLKYKVKSPCVKTMLTILAEKDYYSGELKDTFDENVKRSVLGFQGDAGLSTDGEVGSQTWTAILKGE